MEVALSFATILYTDLRSSSVEMFNTVTKGIIKVIMIFATLIIIPITRIRARKSRQPCPPIGNDLLMLPASEVSRRIRRKKVTSEEVVRAYITRCKEVNPAINAVVEARYEAALREARQVDDSVRSGGRTEEEIAKDTPLLGIPVTVKESIAVRGMSHSVGWKREQPITAQEDADVVKRVRKAGAIPILVSNTPEMCMYWETYNKVTGMTWNPYDTKRSAGGSSGGEAALLGSGASLLSLSSDIGGSARLPAMFCGVFGHKPSPGWISTEGHLPNCDDENWTTFFSIGPMVRYAEDLPVLLKTMCRSESIASKLDRKVFVKDIKFFYMEDDCGSVMTNTVDPEIKTGIHRLVRHLEKTHGTKVQKVEMRDMRFAFEVATAILLGINGADTIFTRGNDRREWKSVSVEALKFLFGKSCHTFPNIVYGILKKFADMSPRSHYENMVEKNKMLKKQFEELLGDNGVLIYPTFVSAASYPFEFLCKICSVSYMMIFNSLGLPVTQCPIGLNRNGLPIGLQVVANAGCDVLSITVAQEIERAFGGWVPPPPKNRIV